MGRVADKVSYKVKNTFVEFGATDEAGYERVRARSDATELNKAPVKGPQSPEEFAELEAAQKAQYVVPNTPSPFLHPSNMEHNGEIPPLTLAESAGGYEMSTFGEIGAEELYGHSVDCYEGADMQGFCSYGVPVMFDPSTGEFTMSGWYMPAEGMVMAPQGSNETDALGQPIEALMDGQVPVEGGVAEQGGMMQALPEGGWAEGGMQGGQMADGSFEGQGWSPDGGVQMDQAGAVAELSKDEGGWSKESSKQDAKDSKAWGKNGGQVEKESVSHDDSGWDEGRSGAWGRKGARGNRRQMQAQGDGSPRNGGGSRYDSQTAQQGGGSTAVATHGESAEGGNQASTSVVPADGSYTTVMLRNIPNKYTREMLVKQLSQDFRGRFDFVYLPIDFKNRCNVGYGFINFRTTEACEEFVTKFNGVDVRKCLPGLNSRKVAEVTPARVQGLDENVRRLRNGPVMNELMQHPEWMPLLLGEDGEEKKFPMPDQPCPPMKPRRRAGGREDHGGNRGW